MEELNELSFERLRLVNEYSLLMKQLQNYLNSARVSFSKARTLHGITLTNLADPDSVDLRAEVRVVDQKSYQIIETKVGDDEVKARKKTSESKEKESQKEEHSHTFRPFGVLEPMVAKEGRKIMNSALHIVCEMATVQREIKNTDEKMKEAAKKVDVAEVMQTLKI